MAKSTPDVVAFHGGEVDSLTLARTDMEGAAMRAEIMENISLVSSGAMSLFPGTIHIGETEDGAQAWLRPWTFSPDLSLALEFTAAQVRFIFGTGYQTIENADATVGVFSDESGAPTTGGEPPVTGEGTEALTVTITEMGEWIEGKSNYQADGTFSISGGNGAYLVPTVEVLTGQADSFFPVIIDGAGTLSVVDADGSAVTFRIKVYDTAGNFGYSGTGSISAAPP